MNPVKNLQTLEEQPRAAKIGKTLTLSSLKSSTPQVSDLLQISMPKAPKNTPE